MAAMTIMQVKVLATPAGGGKGIKEMTISSHNSKAKADDSVKKGPLEKNSTALAASRRPTHHL